MPLVRVSDPEPEGPESTSGDRWPHVAVLLLTWNTWSITIECLESLFRLDYPAFTVVLCDNGSTDGSIDKFREWGRGGSSVALDVKPWVGSVCDPPVTKPIEMVEYTREEAEARDIGPTTAPLVLIHNGENIGY